MKRIAILLAGLGLALAETAQATAVTETSFTAPDGTRTLQHEVVINAPVAIVWKAYTDTAEYRRWGAPVSAIDLRTGGSLEASPDPSIKLGERDTIRHRIVAYLPEKLIVFQNEHVPRMLPHGELLQQTVTIIRYEPLGPGRTRVILSSTGWKDAPEWNGLYRFFEGENAETLAAMKTAYEGKK